MQCPHCGQEHPENAQFCTKTGKKIANTGICPQCGRTVEPDWQHCGFCGQLLVAAPAPTKSLPETSGTPPTRTSQRPAQGNGIEKPAKNFSLRLVGGIAILVCLAAIGFIAFGRGPGSSTFPQTVYPTNAKPSTAVVETITAPAAGDTISPVAGTLDVGIVLPNKDEPRWIQDQVRFTQAFNAAGFSSETLFSQGDPAVEKSNLQALIKKGIRVLIICPQDPTWTKYGVEEAHQAGVKVISYDRLVADTEAVDYFVTFDAISIGEAQAQYLVDHNTARGTPLYLYAGSPSDNRAFLFFEGAWKVLQPRIADGSFVIKNSSEAVSLQAKTILTRDQETRIIGQITTNWDFNTAKNLAEANLTSATTADKGTVAILAPNDGTARAISDAFSADKDVGGYSITGQDAEKASVQYIIDGKQSMTVFKDIHTLANDAKNAAIKYLSGGTPDSTSSYNNGLINIPSNPSKLITVDNSNIQTVLIDSGYYQDSDFIGLKGATVALGMPTSSTVDQKGNAHFSRWGVSFDYPKDWQEESTDQVTAAKAYIIQQLAPYRRDLQEITFFSKPDNTFGFFVSIYTTSRVMTQQDFIKERNQVYVDAQKAGDVTKVNYVKTATVAGLPAILEDVERNNGGRGWTCKIIKGTTIYEISFIAQPASQFPQYQAFLDQLIAELRLAGN